ncbi:hypothetical protein A9Q84_08180 [Halobacteriovorax marinus]|uniref:GYF domain-containing protein n=1 Tax=Halobacteriovorax marinus TaxID=97084 RepID=A0A1Y5F608_9BACT|nr:hypothetical protein A9Q84_08180 [Halobacteriovorax marinus]
MEKCWLIRTKNKQILGPVSKQKILDFVKKGSLAPDDEITSGNGYWFSIKEKTLIEKYLNGDIPQGFNPVTEAPNVLTTAETQGNELTGSLNPNTMPKKESAPEVVAEPALTTEDEDQVPSEDDLGYPDMGASSESSAKPTGDDLEYPEMGDLEYPNMSDVATPTKPTPVQAPVNKVEAPSPVTQVKASANVETQEPGNDEEGKLPESDDLDYPDMGMEAAPAAPVATVDEDATDPGFDFSESSADESAKVSEAVGEKTQDEIIFSEPPLVNEDVAPDFPTEEVSEDSTSKKKSKKQLKKTKKKNQNQRNDKFLLYILFILVGVILFGAYYYFTNVLNSDITKVENPFIQSVHAQVEPKGFAKKKTL